MEDVAFPSGIAIVAEDEAIVRMVAVDMLEEAGFTVVETADARAALSYLAEHPGVRLLFTDIEMPGGMSGVVLAHEVAQCWPDISIVVCSGRMRPEDGSLPAHATFISKPYSHALLKQILNEKGLVS